MAAITPLTDLRLLNSGSTLDKRPEATEVPLLGWQALGVGEGYGLRSTQDAPLAENAGDTLGIAPRSQAVSKLLSAYGKKKQPTLRPQERILESAALLDAALRQGNGDTKSLLDALIDQDVRKVTFLIEGVLKLYEKRYPALETVRRSVNRLEDLLGDYAALKTLSSSDAIPSKQVKKRLEKKKVRARKRLAAELETVWKPLQAGGRIPGIVDVVSSVVSTPWDSYTRDRDVVMNRLADQLRRVVDQEWDMSNFEGGLHELRRTMRWFSIDIAALDGLVAFKENGAPVPQYRTLLKATSEELSALAATDREPNPILLPMDDVVEVARVIAELGELKDRMEEAEKLAELWEDVVPSSELERPEIAGLDSSERAAIIAAAQELAERAQAVSERVIHTLQQSRTQ